MPPPPTFDLQSHSTRSDGALEPAEVVQRAAAAGVELLALTDHDTVGGVAEALAEGERAEVRVVPAVELSAVHGAHEDFHILGYGIDHADAALGERLADARGDREQRADRMAARLAGAGWSVERASLDERRATDRAVGRPHLAAAVLAHPGNAERLREEGLGDVSSFIAAQLIPGTAGYLPRTRPTVADSIAWIHEAGGVAVWAHPFWDLEAADEVLGLLDQFREYGLDGVEAFYAAHTREQTLLAADACEERGLLTTGSADFHGPEHRLFSAFRAFELHGREPRLGPIAG